MGRQGCRRSQGRYRADHAADNDQLEQKLCGVGHFASKLFATTGNPQSALSGVADSAILAYIGAVLLLADVTLGTFHVPCWNSASSEPDCSADIRIEMKG
jgi:hypothetical protein